MAKIASPAKGSGLNPGDSGPQVKQVQLLLQKQALAGAAALKADGKYSEKMKDLVIDFQKRNGLKPDGVIDARTLAKLKKPAPAPTSGGETRRLKALKAAAKETLAGAEKVLAAAAAAHKQLKAVTERLEGLKSDEEMTELAQLELQTMMQRASQATQMLSNIMKKMSDTQKTIVGNLK